jgi:putative peptidoglycan lipid II flippase
VTPDEFVPDEADVPTGEVPVIARTEGEVPFPDDLGEDEPVGEAPEEDDPYPEEPPEDDEDDASDADVGPDDADVGPDDADVGPDDAGDDPESDDTGPEDTEPEDAVPVVEIPDEPGTAVAVTPVVGVEAGTGLRRATALMAVGTTLSRGTGVLRIFALGYALGALRLADSYNLANTMPNIIQDIILGGILSATFVPVFVHRLTTRADDEAWDAVSAVVSVTLIVIGVASVLFLVAVPFIVDATTSLNHGTGVVQSRDLAKDLLFLFVPQLTCYGFISVGTALLNARRKFGAPMFTPIANNVVLIAVLLVFGTVVRHASLGGVVTHRGEILLLGLGTTAGVVAQAGFMIPSLRRAGLKLRWKPDFRHEAVRTIVRLSGWTFGLVMANQAALLVVLALSEKVGSGAVTAYTYSYIFFQLPYGIVAVSIMSATAPELTTRWAQGDLVAFRRRMGTGLRAMLAIIIPAAAGELILARPLVALVINHGAAGGQTALTAQALAMLAIGLPGFCVFLYAIRVLQSVQDLRAAFWLYALENGVNIVLAVALAGHYGVRGIALSISVAYTVAAVAALAYVRARFQGLAGDVLGRPLGHVLLATCALVVAAALGSNVSGSETTAIALGRVALGAGAGGAAYVLAGGGLAELGRRRRRAARERGTDPPPRSGPPPRPDRPPRPDGRPRPPAPRSSAPRSSAPRSSDQRSSETRPDRPSPPPTGWSAGSSKSPSRRRQGAPPRPAPLPPAGRPPMRPGRLGPTKAPDPGGSSPDDAGV